MKPILLPANNFEHFYAGGSKIARFRGLPEQSGQHRPEDWVASTTARDGAEQMGLSELPDNVASELPDAAGTPAAGAATSAADPDREVQPVAAAGPIPGPSPSPRTPRPGRTGDDLGDAT